MYSKSRIVLTLPSHIDTPKVDSVDCWHFGSLNQMSCVFGSYNNIISNHVEVHSCLLWGQSMCQKWGHWRNWAFHLMVSGRCCSFRDTIQPRLPI